MPFEPYLNVEEIESAMEEAAINYPGLCELITLPNLTYEGRTSHAVKLAGGTAADRPGVLFLGGVHAREWGGSDILIAFMENMLSAADSGSGLTFQGKSYSLAETQRIVQTLDIFIFPDVNPDGKAFSQAGNDWRKNRRPEAASVGIDINRNYDFLWDANLYFDPTLSFSYLYTPSSGNYHGPSPFSEAETQNIKYLVDSYPQIAFCIDIHSYGQKLMYIWGDDENQTTEASQTFCNPAHDGQRGLSGDVYGEFIFDFDHQRILRVVDRMYNALFAVRGKSYSTGQIFHQVGVASGTSASYMFGRHVTDPADRKVFGFGIEFATMFQPPPDEMSNVMDDIGATLTEFCLCACEPDLFVRDSLDDTGKEPSMGGLSASPDIIVRKAVVADPAAAFGDITVDPGSDKVEIGNDNYIYVRVHNRGGQDSDAVVRLYAAPLTTSCAPALWEFIDEIDITGIPAGGFKATEAVTWLDVPDPGTGNHFCLVAVCGNTGDPLPDPAMIDSAGDYIAFMRSCNNIAFRNVTFENILLDGWAFVPFVLKGFRGRGPSYDLILDGTDLPKGSRMEVRMHERWLGVKDLWMENVRIIRKTERKKEAVLRVAKGNRGVIHRMRFSPAVAPKIQLGVRIGPGAKHEAAYPVRIVQRFEGNALGRVTVLLRCIQREKCGLLAHRHDRKVHRPKCKQIGRVGVRLLVPFMNFEEAVRDGYKPCAVCLKRP
jgi:carboxypeptidase T